MWWTTGSVAAWVDDLREAVLGALELDRQAARKHAMGFSWERCAQLFVENVLAANRTTLVDQPRRRSTAAIKKDPAIAGRA